MKRMTQRPKAGAHLSATVRFFRGVSAVRKQFAMADALVGYTRQARPLARDYWTLSVWQDQAALQEFMIGDRVEDRPGVEVPAGRGVELGAEVGADPAASRAEARAVLLLGEKVPQARQEKWQGFGQARR